MKFLTLLPLAAVAVARPMWEFDPAKWAFDTAETIIGDSNEVEVTHHHTIWKQLQDEDKYSKLVKILKVSGSGQGEDRSRFERACLALLSPRFLSASGFSSCRTVWSGRVGTLGRPHAEEKRTMIVP